MRQFPRPIGYSSCCLDSIVVFCVIVFAMIHTIIVLKLFIYSELYKHYPNCYPILYFFGQKNGCKQMVGRYAHVRAMKLRYGNNNQVATQFIQPTKRPMSELQKIQQQMQANQKCDAFATMNDSSSSSSLEATAEVEVEDTSTKKEVGVGGFRYIVDAYLRMVDSLVQSLNRNVLHLHDEFVLPPLVKQFSFFS